VKQSFLAEFIIATVMFSGVFMLISYMLLTWTSKSIPPEMTTLFTSLISGGVGATLAKGKLIEPHPQGSLSLVDYTFMVAASAKVFFVINYVFLIWVQRPIPKEISPAIGGLAMTLLAVTTFRNSKSNP
jgi:hypothetical protein